MATNPMQRKARNSFLLGVFITMIIAAIVIAGLLWLMHKQQTEKEEIENSKETVYVLKKDISAGTNIAKTNDKGEVSITDMLKTVEVTKDAVPKNAINGNNYKTAITANSLAKIDLKTGTVLSTDMLVEAENKTENGTREQEYNMIVLPTELEKDDFIDIRLQLPSGEDYIVVAKKKVIKTDEQAMWLNVEEHEILTLSNAIVEAYQIEGSKLYATTYVEPGIQGQASVTYVPKSTILQLIANDPNVIEKAKEELTKKYNNAILKSGRTDIIDAAVLVSEDPQGKVAAGTTSSIEAQKESRSEYVKQLEAKQSQTTTTTNTK